MLNKVHVLAVGYSRDDPSDATCMRANCSCCLVQTANGRNIIIDTMTAWDGEIICKALQNLAGVEPQNIHCVICTHGHSDHTGCNYLFQNADWHFVGTCMSHADKYPEWNFEEPYSVDKNNVVIMATPGHTSTCVSVLVYNAEPNGGTIGICGDLFEREEDVWDQNIWLRAGSEKPQAQRKNRLKMAEICSFIIPGHGPGFQITDDIRHKLQLDVKKE